MGEFTETDSGLLVPVEPVEFPPSQKFIHNQVSYLTELDRIKEREAVILEIKAGPELDRAVAEAIGLVYEQRPSPDRHARECFGMQKTGWWDGDQYVCFRNAPTYSTDLNVAFAAAEKVGLFEEAWFTVNANNGNGVVYWEQNGNPNEGDAIEVATPALAICAAILKLKGS